MKEPCKESYWSRSEEETEAFGRRLAQGLEPPLVILLEGELGSGKTVLTRGLAAGFGLEDPSLVHSPTFTLVNQYPGRAGILYHIDLYRLDTLKDLYSIGLEEILASDGVVIIEWGEKLSLEVSNPLRIRIRPGEKPEERLIDVCRVPSHPSP